MNQVCPTIKANYYKASAANMGSSAHYPHGGGACHKVGQISSPHSQCGSVYATDGLSHTLCACTHGYANYHIVTRTMAHEKLHNRSQSWQKS